MSDKIFSSMARMTEEEAHYGEMVKERIAAFESEDEMIDFINDVGKQVCEDKSW